MGYCFTLETANAVAQLTDGKVSACFNALVSDREILLDFKNSLQNFDENMYTSDRRRQEYSPIIQHLVENIESYYYSMNENYADKTKAEKYEAEALTNIHKGLTEVSRMFSQNRYKALLLPKIFRSKNQNEMNSINNLFQGRDLLKKIAELHPEESCLILQPYAQIFSRSAGLALTDAFSHFDKALKQMHLWPAVLLWNDSGSIFIPVRHEDEVIHIFHRLHDWDRHVHKKGFRYWRPWHDDFLFFLNDRFYNENEKRPHYIIQMSDLHFAKGASRLGIDRLKELIFKQRRSMEANAEISLVITGDMMDSPNAINNEAFCEFINDITRITERDPLIVLGNHDVNKKGIAITHRNQSLIACIPTSGQIVKCEDKKLIYLLFNSNTDGELAQGKIGEAQMVRMGNELDRINNISEYMLIAVLHHHLFHIPEPEWYAKRWYKKLFPTGFLDWTLELKDAELFKNWLEMRNVKLVLHGHKHIPLFNDDKINGVRVLSCGSSTGKVQHKTQGMTYLSYNVVGFHGNIVTCQQFVEDIWGAGAQPIKTDIFEI